MAKSAQLGGLRRVQAGHAGNVSSLFYWKVLRLIRRRYLQAVHDRVVPEAVEALQELVHLGEFVGADAADLVDRADMALIELRNGFGDVLARFRQADADRATVDARALMVDEAEIDQLLDVVGNVGAEVETAGAQFAGRQFGIADVEEEQRLDGIDVVATLAVELERSRV